MPEKPTRSHPVLNQESANETLYIKFHDSIQNVLELSSRIDERVKTLIDNQNNLHEKVEDLIQSHNLLSQRVSSIELVIEHKNINGFSSNMEVLERKMIAHQNDIEKVKEETKSILSKLDKLELESREMKIHTAQSDSWWSAFVSFGTPVAGVFMQIVMTILLAYILYKLGLKD